MTQVWTVKLGRNSNRADPYYSAIAATDYKEIGYRGRPFLEMIMTESIRKFETGATRDTIQGKLDYVRALSPIVLQRYVQYLDAHRLQPDGNMRDFDNWKKGIPIDAYFSGLGRHFMAVWLLAQGFPAEDNHGPVTLEDSLSAIIFNASGWLHELLKIKLNAEAAAFPQTPETVPGYGGDIIKEVLKCIPGDCLQCKYRSISVFDPPCDMCVSWVTGNYDHPKWEAENATPKVPMEDRYCDNCKSAKISLGDPPCDVCGYHPNHKNWEPTNV